MGWRLDREDISDSRGEGLKREHWAQAGQPTFQRQVDGEDHFKA